MITLPRTEWESPEALCYEAMRQSLAAGDLEALRDWSESLCEIEEEIAA